MYKILPYLPKGEENKAAIQVRRYMDYLYILGKAHAVPAKLCNSGVRSI
jgi:hypothetical protein